MAIYAKSLESPIIRYCLLGEYSIQKRMSAIKVWLLTAAENRLEVCITPAASPQGQQSLKTESLFLSVMVMTSSTPCVCTVKVVHTLQKGRGETNCQDDQIICCFFPRKKNSHNFRMHRSTAMQLNSRHRTEFCVTVIFFFRSKN